MIGDQRLGAPVLIAAPTAMVLVHRSRKGLVFPTHLLASQGCGGLPPAPYRIRVSTALSTD